ncbi:Uncharacterized protein APZ42_024382 [Daphnia magna]|uniref:Uncharacterized protein n=1 Tax=Daphnia magna TaxID=35525 RepID=A0A164U2R2_9CRUS|nr:Uncharacterized protein APZ42_024382 [Daphnia magna]
MLIRVRVSALGCCCLVSPFLQFFFFLFSVFSLTGSDAKLKRKKGR